MVFLAAKGAMQIPATCVAGMGEKASPTVNAVSDTLLKPGRGLQDRVQRDLILPNQRTGALILVPIRAKRENFPECYHKKARVSVRMLGVSFTASSYLIAARAARGRARFFYPRKEFPSRPSRTIDATPIAYATGASCQAVRTSRPRNPQTGYLKERTTPSSFQVVAQFS